MKIRLENGKIQAKNSIFLSAPQVICHDLTAAAFGAIRLNASLVASIITNNIIVSS